MTVAAEIETRLRDAFAPLALVVEDQSERHRGHAGWRADGETHFHVSIAAGAFDGMSRIERHRAIHAALGPDLIGRIHALSLDVASRS
jgi:BolA protein